MIRASVLVRHWMRYPDSYRFTSENKSLKIMYMVKGVIFDTDGTMFDTERLSTKG